MRRAVAVVAAVCILAGCRGSGSFGTLPVENQSLSLPRSSGKATVYFNFTVPKAKNLRSRFVSPNTQSLTVAVNGGSPQAIGLTPATNPNCSGATPPIVCTNLSVIAPIGSDTFTFKIYKEALVNGHEPAHATLLATYTTPYPIEIVEGTSNRLGNFVLNGVPSTATLTPGTLVAPADGHVHEFTLAATIKDASGATIVAPGNFSAPIALQILNDPNHALSVTPQQLLAPSTSGTEQIRVTYDASKALVSGTISIALGNQPTFSQVNPLVYTLSSDAPLVVGGSKRTITVSEAHYGGAFTVSVLGSAVTARCVPASCTPASSGGAITIDVEGQRVGLSQVSIADTNGVTATVSFSVISQAVFHYTGASQSFVVPYGIDSITVTAYGAQGGAVKNVLGGRGGRTKATVAVSPGSTLGVYVGGRGADESNCTGGPGGFNGGGNGGDADSYPKCNGNKLGGGGGGGGSDVRIPGRTRSVILIVAGGGGGAADQAGGRAGGPDGSDGTGNNWCTGGRGGTQTRGGAAGTCTIEVLQPGKAGIKGFGGNGGAGEKSGGAGGGGGYYGGGGTPGTVGNHGPGGGGAGSSYALSSQTIFYGLGVREGNGLVEISW